MKLNFFRILVFVLLCLCLIGCASVNVIHGVAQQNLRNSEALKKNIEQYLSETEPLLIAAIEIKLSERYSKVGKNISEESKKASKNQDSYQAYFEKRSYDLKTNIEKLKSYEAQEKEKEVFRLSEPLAAAVAFDNLSKEEAAKTAELFIEIATFSHLNDYEKQIARYNRLKTLKPIKEWEKAKFDIIISLRTIQSIIVEQTSINVHIANQLKTASETSKDPSAFLKGVSENNDLYKAIATVVAHNTNDENRKKAAEALIDSLKE